jgi:hypothetical protein
MKKVLLVLLAVGVGIVGCAADSEDGEIVKPDTAEIRPAAAGLCGADGIETCMGYHCAQYSVADCRNHQGCWVGCLF